MTQSWSMPTDSELLMFLNLPVADGLEAVEIALSHFRSSSGKKRQSAERMLVALRLMFDKLAPRSLSASRWEKLRAEIAKAIGEYKAPDALCEDASMTA